MQTQRKSSGNTPSELQNQWSKSPRVSGLSPHHLYSNDAGLVIRDETSRANHKACLAEPYDQLLSHQFKLGF